jgi:hypothetical protein
VTVGEAAFPVVIVATLAVLFLMIVLGAAFGWERYRGGGSPPAGAPPGGARPTGEVFVDPETGRLTRVWYDDRTGVREYRPE